MISWTGLGRLAGILGIIGVVFSLAKWAVYQETRFEGLEARLETLEAKLLSGRISGQLPLGAKKPAQAPEGTENRSELDRTSREPGTHEPEELGSEEPFAVLSDLDYEFQLHQCSISGQSVTCDLILINKADDRRLFVSKAEPGITTGTYGVRGSKIFDEQSSEHFASTVRLANQTSDRRRIGPAVFLVSGTEVPLQLRFEGVSSQSRKITRLFVNCWDFASESKLTITFEDVPLLKS